MTSFKKKYLNTDNTEKSYSPEFLQKKDAICEEAKKIVNQICHEEITVRTYGAIDMSASNMSFVIETLTDKTKDELIKDKQLNDSLNKLFTKHSYPLAALPYVKFSFESKETKERQFRELGNGNLRNLY